MIPVICPVSLFFLPLCVNIAAFVHFDLIGIGNFRLQSRIGIPSHKGISLALHAGGGGQGDGISLFGNVKDLRVIIRISVDRSAICHQGGVQSGPLFPDRIQGDVLGEFVARLDCRPVFTGRPAVNLQMFVGFVMFRSVLIDLCLGKGCVFQDLDSELCDVFTIIPVIDRTGACLQSNSDRTVTVAPASDALVQAAVYIVSFAGFSS